MSIRKVMGIAKVLYAAWPAILTWATRGVDLFKTLIVRLTKSKKF